MNLGQHEESQLPECLGNLVQPSVEAALGEGLDVAMADEKVERFVLVSGEELSGNRCNGHDLSGRELSLSIVFMSNSFEQFVEEAVEGYNFFWHQQTSVEIGVDNLTLPSFC